MSDRARIGWLAAALGAAVAAAYAVALPGSFDFDDATSIVSNESIHRLLPVWRALMPPVDGAVTVSGRPLLNLSLAVNYALGGVNPWGYRVGNVLIHLAAAMALFGIVRRTLQRTGQVRSTEIGFAIAAIWALHPLQTEAVSYIIQRAESLMGLFYLLTLYCFVRSVQGRPPNSGASNPPVPAAAGDEKSSLLAVRRSTWRSVAGRWPRMGSTEVSVSAPLGGPNLIESRPPGEGGPELASLAADPVRRGWLFLSVLCCWAGMGTKEVMVSAPLIVLLYDRTFVAGTFAGAWRGRKRYYMGLGASWGLLAGLVLSTGGNRGGSVGWAVGVSPWDYGLTQFKAIATYLRLTLWPHPLVFEYGVFWARGARDILPGAGLIAALLWATIRGLRKNTVAGFLGTAFFFILAPSSLVPGTTQMIVEHRMYLPLAAVITAIVLGVERRISLRASWFAVAVVLGLITVARNYTYRSAIALWSDTVAKAPNNPLAHEMLGDALAREGDDSGAIGEYSEAIRLKPNFSVAQAHLGEACLLTSRVADAIAHYEIAVRLQPKLSLVQDGLGRAYAKAGRHEDALRVFRTLEALSPDYADGHYAAANELAALGRDAEAVPEYERTLRLHPGYPEAEFNLANSLSDLGRVPEAALHYAVAVRLKPDYPAAEYNWANALALHGDPAGALPHYEAAVRLDPRNADAEFNAGSACLQLGRRAEAAAHYRRVLALRPDDTNTQRALALALQHPN